MSRRIAIVGAGFAGLAAGVELARQGIGVDIFEASRTLGGRARKVDGDELVLDNGVHILSGAYGETLRLMQLVGAPRTGLLRLPLALEFPGRFCLQAPRLPAPLHLALALLTARGLAWSDKAAAVAFMRRMRQTRFRLDSDTTVSTLLASQPEAARRFLWEPLCLAALNTLPERASAQVFLNVLRDSLAAKRAASDLLLPTIDLSSLLPIPAARYIETHGGRVELGRRITRIQRTPTGFAIDEQGAYAQAVLAVAPQHLPALIGEFPELAALTRQVGSFLWEPIVTCYLAYPKTVRLPRPMLAVLGGTAQWLFDRGQTHGQAGLIAGVTSASRRQQDIAAEDLAREIDAEVRAVVPSLPKPRWQRIITERRATFACTPNLSRPQTPTAVPGLHLAGDYIAGDYPATIEGAVRSGTFAAQSVIDQFASDQV
jgi:squalene-associated FAD-dependent desaturase